MLVRLPNKLTLCRIYKKRLGHITYKNSPTDIGVCAERKDDPNNYPGCPYNKGKEGGEESRLDSCSDKNSVK